MNAKEVRELVTKAKLENAINVYNSIEKDLFNAIENAAKKKQTEIIISHNSPLNKLKWVGDQYTSEYVGEKLKEKGYKIKADVDYGDTLFFIQW